MSDRSKTVSTRYGRNTFVPSEEGNTCSEIGCESDMVRVPDKDSPERMYCVDHCTTPKRRDCYEQGGDE